MRGHPTVLDSESEENWIWREKCSKLSHETDDVSSVTRAYFPRRAGPRDTKTRSTFGSTEKKGVRDFERGSQAARLARVPSCQCTTVAREQTGRLTQALVANRERAPASV